MKKSTWFRWETEASIHHLFLVLEAANRPLKEYFGKSWPETVLIYRGKHVIWSNRWSQLYELGQAMIDFYFDKKNEDMMWQDWQKATKALIKFFEKLDKTDFSKLNHKELLDLYEDFRKVYFDFWKIGWLDEPIALRAEKILKEESNLSDNEIAILTSPTWRSF